MAQPYIIYNSVKSTDVGVIVEQLPDFHRAARRVTITELPGSSIPIVADEGGYSPYQTQMRINANGVDLRDIYQWLSGEGWLVSSDEPDFKAYAYLYTQADDARFRAGGECHDTLTVPLIVEPYLREKNEAEIDVSEACVFEGHGHVASMPGITVYGSGDISLMVNDRTVLIDNLGDRITIDSESGTATRGASSGRTWMGHKVTLEDGWPELLPAGETNEINWSGNVTRVRIHPNWRYL
jgi:phage-related protein